MMNAMHFCEECGAANAGQSSSCFACHTPLALPSSNAVPADGTATFTQVPVGNGKIAYQLAESDASQDTVGQLPKGFVLHERYVIIQQVGQGGFGIVYKARDKKRFNRLVAIKQITLANLSPRDIIQATDSYNREVELQFTLRHRNIPILYQHFTDPKNWYLIMEFIKGETLEHYLQRTAGGKLPPREALRIGMQLCKVLGYLHTKHRIIFRDVKPANIMRTLDGRVYLIDFGIARRYAHSKNKDTAPLGSPGYAAPEQYGLRQTSAQTDIFGLGATLLTLLTGADLSDDTNTNSQAPPLPEATQTFLDSMLEREVYKRPESMEAVYKQLFLLKTGIWGKLWYRARPALMGVLLGCIPFLFFFSFYLGSFPQPFAGIAFSSCFSPLVAIAVFITALTFLYKPRRRLIGACILMTMLLLTILIVITGIAAQFWLPMYFG